jgi:hypothetical protein
MNLWPGLVAPRHQAGADFLRYAAEGLVDQLRQQIAQVQSMQSHLAWENFINEQFRSQTQGEASRRRRAPTSATALTYSINARVKK